MQGNKYAVGMIERLVVDGDVTGRGMKTGVTSDDTTDPDATSRHEMLNLAAAPVTQVRENPVESGQLKALSAAS